MLPECPPSAFPNTILHSVLKKGAHTVGRSKLRYKDTWKRFQIDFSIPTNSWTHLYKGKSQDHTNNLQQLKDHRLKSNLQTWSMLSNKCLWLIYYCIFAHDWSMPSSWENLARTLAKLMRMFPVSWVDHFFGKLWQHSAAKNGFDIPFITELD